jgi:nucleolar complex protein 3
MISFSGEALNIDLADFITQLYVMILPLTLMNVIESKTVTPPNKDLIGCRDSAHISSNSNTLQASTPSLAIISPPPSISDLLFGALRAVFSLRAGAGTAPPWRSAAFAKRLLSAALHWPPETALRALDLIHDLIAKHPKVEALLSTEDRAFDGIYRPDVDDPQLCHPYGTAFWELQTLAMSHMDPAVRASASKLLKFSSSNS